MKLIIIKLIAKRFEYSNYISHLHETYAFNFLDYHYIKQLVRCNVKYLSNAKVIAFISANKFQSVINKELSTDKNKCMKGTTE